MALEIGQLVELMGVENAGLDITGKRGTVTEIPEHGLVSVTIDDGSGAVVSAWPENLKVVRSTQAADERSAVEIGQAVQITRCFDAHLISMNGKRGTLTDLSEEGIVSVTIDGSGEVVSLKMENLTPVTST